MELFTCYSTNLKDFLTSKGIKYKITGLHPETKSMFWVYIKNEQLCNCLAIWKTRPTAK